MMLKALLIGSALSLPVLACAESFQASGFAFNTDVELMDDAAVYKARVPLEIYQSVTRADLGDLRVYNAAGQQVPHNIRPAPQICGYIDDAGWQVLDVGASSESNEFDYEASGWLPIDTVIVEFSEPNTIAGIEISSREAAHQKWQLRYRGSAYTMRNGHSVVNSEPVSLDPRNHRYWRLTVDTSGGGIGNGTPRLRVGWRAHELLFVARGSAPYKLAFGNAAAPPVSSTVENLLARLEHDHGDAVVGTAAVSVPIKVIDRAFLQSPPEPLAWRLIVLWSALIAGAGVLGWSALSLLREIQPA